ncbi:phosphatidylethanolamine-binding protein [Lophiotrema nucula]|uniref:Phosphatidylethanolamine-binding protein n=1 Tax=Lophiotrema nucula TaxID=690887 RepID=A0A6A5ZTV1_9PLEO|nr:phosphatidylethanolamine-binding protein [Lophiotrema nucula]
MYANTLILGVSAIAGALADTGPGFPVQVGPTLNVTFGGNNVSPAGELIPRADTASPPNVTTPVFTSAGKAVLFMVDSDVPRNGTRVELLHWLISNVTLAGDNQTLSFSGEGEAPYLQPSPPVGDTPHAYTLVLFPQPDNFTVPSQFNDVLESRVFFNISNFVAAAGLSNPLAGNYIRVQNVSGTATQTFPPPRPTNATTSGSPSATSSIEPSPGLAAPALGAGRVAWVGIATALVAGVAAFAL